MKTKYIIASSLIVPMALIGCQDLDTFPEGDIVTEDQKSEVYERNPAQAEAAVNAIYAQFSQLMPNESSIGEAHNDIGYPTIMLATDANSMDVIQANTGYNWSRLSLIYEDRSYTSQESQMVWNDLYSIIFSANTAIASFDPEIYANYIGQAKTVRAFAYFQLAQLYQFTYKGHENSPCVPIITDENVAEAEQNGMARATVQEVYDFILDELDEAIEYLEADYQPRADRRYVDASVAYGVRARVNLVMQNWSAAAADAQTAIDASDASAAEISGVDHPTFWSMNEPNWMWGIAVAETDDVVSSGIVNWISHMGSLNNGYGNYSGGKQINISLYETISETDVRKGWWLNENGMSANLSAEQDEIIVYFNYPAYTQVKFGPYNDEVYTSVNANCMPLMRIEEMYYILAEAQAMGGSLADGQTTLNDFVSEYRDPEYSFAASSAEDLQDEIYRQRRIEFWGEGMVWFDIMRLNKDVDRRGAGYAPTVVYNIPAGSDILLWRIPQNEINTNKAISETDNNPVAPAPSPVADFE